MFKYTINTLKKIEELCKDAGYVVRYEKGNFNAGYCILEHKKVFVINKYFDTEARINCLVEILADADVQVDVDTLSEPSKELYGKITRQTQQQ